MLEQWIYKGKISDPYSEFLVEENEERSKNKHGEEGSIASISNLGR